MVEAVHIIAAFCLPRDMMKARGVAVMGARSVRSARAEDTDGWQLVARCGVLPVDAVFVLRPAAVTHETEHRVIEGSGGLRIAHGQVEMVDEAPHECLFVSLCLPSAKLLSRGRAREIRPSDDWRGLLLFQHPPTARPRCQVRPMPPRPCVRSGRSP